MWHFINPSPLETASVSACMRACVTSTLHFGGGTKSAHGLFSTFRVQVCSHETVRDNHMTEARRDGGDWDEPTLVMGASIVME